MKKIWTILKHHVREDFSLLTYGITAALLVVMLRVNYAVDFEDTVLDTQAGFRKFFYYLLYFSIPYYVTVAITTHRRSTRVWTRAFIVKSAFALVILSIDASLPFVYKLLSNIDDMVYLWSYKVTVNLISLVTVLLPLFVFYRTVDQDRNGFYGLTPERFDPRPYFQMLLIMLPVIAAATTLPSFLRQYPMYKPTEAHVYFGAPEAVTALAYELAYGLDFVTVELLFRGFFVIGMASLLGRKAVLPMAVIYCQLHFGKPAGEAISSIFGGFILGVIAFETRSIWGGVIVHVGIAWMMELVSFIAKKL